MASSMANKGQEYMLMGTTTPNGGIANLATALRLYDSTSTPNKNGTGFNQLAGGNGYTTGGVAITRSNWTLGFNGADRTMVLNDITFTATGGSLVNIAGAYLVDGSNNVLAWWERASPVTLTVGQPLTLDDLSITPR